MKKTFEISVKIKDCSISFKENMGRGEIATKLFTYDLDEKEYMHPMFVKSLLDEESRLVKEVIETEIKEVNCEDHRRNKSKDRENER